MMLFSRSSNLLQLTLQNQYLPYLHIYLPQHHVLTLNDFKWHLISVLQNKKEQLAKEIVSMKTKKMKIKQYVPSLFPKKALYYEKGYNNNLCLLFSQ